MRTREPLRAHPHPAAGSVTGPVAGAVAGSATGSVSGAVAGAAASVRVWTAPAAFWPDPGLLLPVLGPDERARADRFRREPDRASYLAAHALLRHALSRCRPEVAPREWEFTANKWGRPLLAGETAVTGLRFSISRRHAMVACAVTEGPACGIDVEYVHRPAAVDGLIDSVLAPAERAELTGTTPEDRRTRFYRLWTLKEAYTKALGKGLHLPFDECVFTLDGTALPTGGSPSRAPTARPRLLDSPGLPPGGGGSWWLEQWRADPDHLVALAVHRGRSAPVPDVRIVRDAAPWQLPRRDATGPPALPGYPGVRTYERKEHCAPA